MADLTITLTPLDNVWTSNPTNPVVEPDDVINFYNTSELDIIVTVNSSTKDTVLVDAGGITPYTVPDYHCMSFTVAVTPELDDGIITSGTGGVIHIGT